MKRCFYLLVAIFLICTGLASATWQRVAELTLPNCSGCVASVAVSPSGNTVVIGGAPPAKSLSLFAKPAAGWSNASNPTLLETSDQSIFAFGEGTHGVETNDTTVIGEAFQYIGTSSIERQVLLVWQEPANGWASQTVVKTSFVLSIPSPYIWGLEALWGGMAVNDETIVVGARSELNQQGAIYVWNNPPQRSAPIARLAASDGMPAHQLGYSLSISGDTIAAGSCPIAGYGNGAVYIFQKPAQGWKSGTQTAKLTYPADGPTGFGCFTASSNDTIASGVPSYNDDDGRVDIFSKPPSGWADSSTPTAEIGASLKTGGFFGGTANLGTSISGDTMLVASAAYINTEDSAENIFYEPDGGWNSKQQPDATIDILNPQHFNMNGRDGAGTNIMVIPNCSTPNGFGSPISVYQDE
jgi:hypothetical protein